MKFGRSLDQNKIQEFRDFYLDYNDLKKKIKALAIERRKSLVNTDHTNLLSDIESNINRIEELYIRELRDIENRFENIREKYDLHDNGNLSDNVEKYGNCEDLLGCLIALRSQVYKLSWFAEINRRGLMKISKKLSRHLEIEATLLQSKLAIAKFLNDWTNGDYLETLNKWIDAIQVCQSNSLQVNSSESISSLSNTSLNLLAPDLDTMHQAITDDSTKMLDQSIVRIKSEYPETNFDKWLQNYLMLAFLERSKACSLRILKIIKNHDKIADINERNIFHRYMIKLGHKNMHEVLPNCSKEGSNSAEYIIQKLNKDLNALNQHDPTAVHFDFETKYYAREISSDPDRNFLKFLLDKIDKDNYPLILARDSFGKTPLHYASQFGIVFACEIIIKFMCCRNLIQKSPVYALYSPEWQDRQGLTPIHLSVASNHINCLRPMLQSNSSQEINVNLERSQPALIVAVENKFNEIARMLIKANFSTSQANKDGITALHIAARKNSEIIESILNSKQLEKTELELKDYIKGWTPIFYACVEGAKEAVQTLINAGASCEHLDYSGWTVLEHATYRGFIDLTHLIYSTLPKDFKFSLQNYAKSFEKECKTKFSNEAAPLESDLVKVFGHKHLIGETLLLLNLGSLDVRKSIQPLELDFDTALEEFFSPYHTALSLLIYAKGKRSDAYSLDIPIDPSVIIEPISIFSKYDSKIQINFDIIPSDPKKRDEVLARAVLQLTNLKKIQGKANKALQGIHSISLLSRKSLEIVGCVNLQYTIITSFSHPKMGMQANNTYWKSLIRTRVIGHRGLGKNQLNGRIQLGENTIQSFIAAASLGASYVEFDVQMTKDMVPVIYHDFLVSETGLDVPMHMLTFDQFMAASPKNTLPLIAQEDPGYLTTKDSGLFNDENLRRNNGGDDLAKKFKNTLDFKRKQFKGISRGLAVQAPFTTLEEILKCLPKNIGLNIECKYPMINEAEDNEMDNIGIDLNSWVDRVVSTVFEYGEGRDIVFSSFHPDVCSFLTMKQAIYPILFLTDAGTMKNADLRANSLQEAIRFAIRWNLLGIVTVAEPLVMCPRLIRAVKERGLVLFTYGTQNNSPEIAKNLLCAGVDAVIVDSVMAIRKGLQAK